MITAEEERRFVEVETQIIELIKRLEEMDPSAMNPEKARIIDAALADAEAMWRRRRERLDAASTCPVKLPTREEA